MNPKSTKPFECLTLPERFGSLEEMIGIAATPKSGEEKTPLFSAATHRPSSKAAANSTAKLGLDDVPQPDGLLRILPECEGQSRVNARGYLQGGPIVGPVSLAL